LYGTAQEGGTWGEGTLFKVNTDGTGFTTLHSFTALDGLFPYPNSNGAIPYGGLILAGSNLYGTASIGGGSGYGTVFRVTVDGTASYCQMLCMQVQKADAFDEGKFVHAAAFFSSPSTKTTPSITLARNSEPFRRRQFF
jgi:uncharacterized repeat protein (TIGR03803 family)